MVPNSLLWVWISLAIIGTLVSMNTMAPVFCRRFTAPADYRGRCSHSCGVTAMQGMLSTSKAPLMIIRKPCRCPNRMPLRTFKSASSRGSAPFKVMRLLSAGSSLSIRAMELSSKTRLLSRLAAISTNNSVALRSAASMLTVFPH